MGEASKHARYVIVTPARDEERYIESTIQSVVSQSVRPIEWIVVDDGSTDRTGNIIDEYSRRYPWIRPVHRKNRGFRKAGDGVIAAYYDGYAALTCHDWDFVVKLDGDLSFDTDYFERVFERFLAEPRLGVAGGTIYHIVDGSKQIEQGPRFHVRGATKIYRRQCWEEIGSLWQGPGWDTIDEVKANMLGWNTATFPDIHLIHHRLTGSADGKWAESVKHGVVCYTCGYHPLFVAASSVYRLVHKPYFVGGAGTIYGFVDSYIKRRPRVEDEPFIKYVRHEQLMRLLGKKNIWR